MLPDTFFNINGPKNENIILGLADKGFSTCSVLLPCAKNHQISANQTI